MAGNGGRFAQKPKYDRWTARLMGVSTDTTGGATTGAAWSRDGASGANGAGPSRRAGTTGKGGGYGRGGSEHGIGGLPTKKNAQRTKRRGEGATLEIRRVVRRHDDRCRK
eukprot:COSAG02_NODE_3577_length_6537_cov_17.172414_1_plen_110_part_00